jgi:hypothetical protein
MVFPFSDGKLTTWLGGGSRLTGREGSRRSSRPGGRHQGIGHDLQQILNGRLIGNPPERSEVLLADLDSGDAWILSIEDSGVGPIVTDEQRLMQGVLVK